MPTVSGTLYYDGNRTATVATATGVIASVPVALQDMSGNVLDTVLTNSDGTFQFSNVVAGNYLVSEAWDGVIGKCPPLDNVILNFGVIPPGATNLDCTIHNTWIVSVDTSPVTNINMMNGPVKYTPLTIAPNVLVDPSNLVTASDGGTFGLFPAGTAANTGVEPAAGTIHPYPEILSDFNYVMPQVPPPTSVVPNDGQYTVQNIMSAAWGNSHPSTALPSWWRIADHTTGNETGRAMIVNGYTKGFVIKHSTITVQPNTKYMVSYWVLNLCRQPTGYVNPEFSAVVLAEDGTTEIYRHSFTDEIVINPLCPEWVQIGTIFDSGDNAQVAIRLLAEGGPQTGNDFAIDDVALNRVDVLELVITKSASCSIATSGGIIDFIICIENQSDFFATQVTLIDDLTGCLVDPKFTIDGENWYPWTGSLEIDSLGPKEIGCGLIRGEIKQGLTNIITNKASVQATFCAALQEEEK